MVDQEITDRIQSIHTIEKHIVQVLTKLDEDQIPSAPKVGMYLKLVLDAKD